MQNPAGNMQTTAYDQLRDMIIHAELIPGEKISEATLMTQLRLGRTPLREAMIQLRQQGLVEMIPQSGTYITKIDLTVAEDARFVREVLERRIVKEAIQAHSATLLTTLKSLIAQAEVMSETRDPRAFFQFDNDFHHALFQAANKDTVWKWLQSLNMQLDRFRWLRLSVTALDWKTIIAQHQEILQAVAAGDAAAGEKLIGQHLKLMLEEEGSLLKQYPDYFVER